MSFLEDEQQPASAASEEQRSPAEPRLLTRPDRQHQPTTSPVRHRQAPAEKGLDSFAKQLAAKRGSTGRHGSAKGVRSGRLRRWGLLGGGVAALLLLVAVGVIFYLRHTINTSLPQLDGTVTAPGLMAKVTVARDAQGVPTLTAASLPDLLYAQGYVTASDRLWQMDALRRHAAGELAEVLGSSMIEHDRRQRYLQIRAAADRAVAQLPGDQRQQLEAYARGVNAFIDTHRSALPVEFHLLAYSPAPWTPRDSLLVSLAMWEDLSTEFPRKMDRDALSAHLPGELLRDLYPVGSWRDVPPAAQGRDITAPHVVEQIPLDPSQSRAVPPAGGQVSPASLMAVTRAFGAARECDSCRAGSNNWAVSGMHTASGAPLLSNDMHLNLMIPDAWYEASLHAEAGADGTPRFDVTGFTLPGVPFVMVGRNNHVAWGVTNLGADVQDVRVEHLRGAGESAEYERADGSWAAVTHHEETIRVRGGLNVKLDVLSTRHPGVTGEMETPVISALYPGESRALSLAWTAYDPEAVTSPFYGVNAATDGVSLVAAFAHFGGPTLNLVWADSGNHIGYHAIGFVPVRGPAVQHPRDVPAVAPAVEPGAPVPDEGAEEPEAGPEAELMGRPHVVLSAYHPARRRAAVQTPRRARTADAGRRRVARGRQRQAPARAPRTRPSRARREATPQVVEAPLPVTAPVVNYTIGSPIMAVPVDARDGAQAWSGYIPYEAMPSVVDPHNGLLATANGRITPDDYPYYVANDWADPFRAERLVHLLAGRKGLTPEDMLHIEVDVHSDVNLIMAQRLAYAVDHASQGALGANAARLHEAANVLRDWNGDMNAGSAGAAIVSSVRPVLWSALLVPQIAAHDGVDARHAATLAELYTWGERSSALELLIQHEPARWLPAGTANWNDLLTTSLASALTTAHAPGNLGRWQYGEVHTVEIAHPIFGTHRLLSRLFGIRATTGRQPAPGDGTTVDQIGAHFGPSERFTADLSSEDAALGNITTGEAANPHSAWYLDQFRPWLAGRTFSLPNAHTEATHTLVLTP